MVFYLNDQNMKLKDLPISVEVYQEQFWSKKVPPFVLPS